MKVDLFVLYCAILNGLSLPSAEITIKNSCVRRNPQIASCIRSSTTSKQFQIDKAILFGCGPKLDGSTAKTSFSGSHWRKLTSIFFLKVLQSAFKSAWNDFLKLSVKCHVTDQPTNDRRDFFSSHLPQSKMIYFANFHLNFKFSLNKISIEGWFKMSNCAETMKLWTKDVEINHKERASWSLLKQYGEDWKCQWMGKLGQEAMDVLMERKWKGKKAKRRHRTDRWSLEVNWRPFGDSRLAAITEIFT